MQNENIPHLGHRERLRRRIRDTRVENLKEHELVEFLLYYTIPRQNVNDLAHSLLERFGSLKGILTASEEDLSEVEGLGLNAAQWLNMTGQFIFPDVEQDFVESQNLSTYSLFLDYVRGIKHLFPDPCCIQICTNREKGVIYQRKICNGLEWANPKVMMGAIDDIISTGANGAFLVLFSNEDDPKPTPYDSQHAARYKFTLNAAGCNLVDFVVLGKEGSSSLWREGLLSQKCIDPVSGVLFEGCTYDE